MFPKHLPFAVAATPIGGVVIARYQGDYILFHVSRRLGTWNNRSMYDEACARAKAKLNGRKVS